MSRRILKSLRARLVKAAGIVARSRNLALATVLFGAMFVAMDTLLLPSDSQAGRMLHGPPNRRVSGYVSGYAVESDGAIRIEPRLPFVERDILATADCSYAPRRFGLWAITREKYDATVRIIAPNPLSNDQQARIRAAMADRLAFEEGIYPPFLEWVRQGRTKVERVFWVGYLHNSITAIVATAVIVIVFFEVVLLHEGRRVRRAIGAGLCASCGYDLRGSVSDVCPECGAAVNRIAR